jgi:putative hydrolase of the HAD superfamily
MSAVTSSEATPIALPVVRRPEALLLDAGDTLLFFDAHATAEALAVQGVALAPAALDGALLGAKQRYQQTLRSGLAHEEGWTVLVRELLTRAGLALDVANAALPGLRAVHDDLNLWRRIPEELPPALARAREAGLRLGVVSNSEGRLSSVLDRLGIGQYFEVVIDSHLEGVNKPDPEIFRRALVRMQLAAERSLYAGDIPEVDVLGARAAGMEGVVIDPLGHHVGSAWPRVSSTAVLIDALLALPRS